MAVFFRLLKKYAKNHRFLEFLYDFVHNRAIASE